MLSIRKEVKLLKQQNKQKDEVIHDLDANNYKQKYNTILAEKNILSTINNEQKEEIKDLKKKSKRLAKAIRNTESKNRKR